MSVPSVELRPRLGVRKPERRRSPTGKPKTGAARIGTPWKYSFAVLAEADSSSPSNSIFSAWIHHASSPGAQVVKRAWLIRACWLPRNSISDASPRACRGAYVKLALRHRAGLRLDPEVEPRTGEHGALADTRRALPSTFTSSVACVYVIRSPRSTLPSRRISASPWSTIRSSIVPSMLRARANVVPPGAGPARCVRSAADPSAGATRVRPAPPTRRPSASAPRPASGARAGRPPPAADNDEVTTLRSPADAA